MRYSADGSSWLADRKPFLGRGPVGQVEGTQPFDDPLPSAATARYVASVYWFRRPPYLRWTAAALLVITATWLDLRPEPTVRQPFAAVDLAAGVSLDDTMVEWRSVPTGFLPPLENPQGIVLRAVAAGEPLSQSMLSTERITVPEGWWSMEVQLPTGAVPGQNVQLIVLGTAPDMNPWSIPGIIIAPAPEGDPLAFEELPGLVAVPAESATVAAAAVAEARVAVILGG